MKFKTLMREEHRSVWLDGTAFGQGKSCDEAPRERDHEPPRRKEYDPPVRHEQLVPGSMERASSVRSEGDSEFEEPRLGHHGGVAAYPPQASYTPLQMNEGVPGSPAAARIKKERQDDYYNQSPERNMPTRRDVANLQRMAQLYRQAAAMQMGMMQYGYPVRMAPSDMCDPRASPAVLPWPMAMPMFLPPQLYQPPASSSDQALDEISKEILDSKGEADKVPVQLPYSSPLYGRGSSYINNHKTPKRQREVTPPPALTSLPTPSPENYGASANIPLTEEENVPWSSSLREDLHVKEEPEEEESDEEIMQPPRSKRACKETEDVSVDDDGQSGGNFPRYYKCGACSLRMRSRQGLSKHFTSHGTNLPDLPAVCGICHEALPNAYELDCHVRLHDEAGKELLQRRRAEKGVRRRHVCHHCGKSLAKRHSLVEHLRIHTGEKPYTCEHCNESLRSWPVYWKHMRRHRGMKYKCTNCKMEFKDQYCLQMHSCSLDFMLQS